MKRGRSIRLQTIVPDGGASALVAAVCLSFSAAWSTERVVHPDGAGDYPTIQSAVDAAADGDEIVLTDGLFSGEGNRGILIFDKSIVVRSQSGVPTQCVVDSEALDHGFMIEYATDVTVQGVTVTRATGHVSGAIQILSSSPVFIVNCCLRNNESEQGAGVFAQWSRVTLERCLIVDNRTTLFGGGGVTIASGEAEIRNCTIAYNSVPTATAGSAIGCFDATVTVDSSILSNNGLAQVVSCDLATAIISCSNVFGNPGGDWTGCLTGQDLHRGNFSADPLFCDSGSGDYTVRVDSPCVPPASDCGLVGALSVGCDQVGIDTTSWATVKAGFR